MVTGKRGNPLLSQTEFEIVQIRADSGTAHRAISHIQSTHLQL